MIEKVNFPSDLKNLSISELNSLAGEIRQILINKIQVTGGHLGSNLGIVEATIALHYVFNAPKDKIVFDVSHQSYTHKILTGRKEFFINPDKFDGVSGYTTPSESEYDLFKVGHTSTSLSLAAGLAKGRDMLGRKENVIAVIGDGSMSGGEAYEGLDNISTFKSNLIILFNDNEMSIAPNVGGIYKNFAKLRETKGEYENNFFKTFGLDYIYVEEGNNVEKLIEVFNKVKDIDHPIVVHIHTKKGLGSEWAEQNKELGHYFSPYRGPRLETPESFTRNYLLERIKENLPVVAISAATPGGVGLDQAFRDEAKDHFVDVGICEEHAVAFSSGIAKNGAIPYFIVSASFIQRTYDQLNQDVALSNTNPNIIVMRGQISGGDATHVGQYDIALVNSIPNLVCVAPYYIEEYKAILDYSLNKNHPLIIRAPLAIVHKNKEVKFNSVNDFKYEIVENGRDIAIIGLGSFFGLGQKVCALLKEKGYKPTLVNPLIYSSLDEKCLDELSKNHKVIITLEDGVVAGGWGERVSSYLGAKCGKLLNYGGEKSFNDLVSKDEIYKKQHLNPEQIVEDIENLLK